MNNIVTKIKSLRVLWKNANATLEERIKLQSEFARCLPSIANLFGVNEEKIASLKEALSVNQQMQARSHTLTAQAEHQAHLKVVKK